MRFDSIQTACVIHYPYLWVKEADRGESSGRKSRPVTVGVRLVRPNAHDLIILFPITSKEPERSRFAIEIPETERRRAGLDVDKRLWIIFDEYNADLVGKSFDLKPQAPLGKFSKAFFLPHLKNFITRRSEFRGVNRRA